MTLEEKQAKLISNLSIFPDAQERLAYVISQGKKHGELDEADKVEENRIEGCVSNLWIVPEYREGRCYYRCDADALTTKGVAVVLCDFYSGHPPEEIVKVDPSFLKEGGVTQHLSQNRSNGLANAWGRIKGFAEAQMG